MKAIVYQGPEKKEFIDVEKPNILKPTDVIVKMKKTTICGTDLHILKGDTPEVRSGTILGHEGIGVVTEVGESVANFKIGESVIISCITSCGHCENCKKGLYAHCEDGGWILGHLIDGTQAEYVRIPHADNSLHHIPKDISEEGAVMISDILPTGLEIGVIYGAVKPGDTIAIVGVGPIGLATLLTAQFYSPSKIIALDLDKYRLNQAKRMGATHTINSSNQEEAIRKILEITDGKGVDVAIEAVGTPSTFDLCQKTLIPGGHLANVGVHGKPVSLNLQDLWINNITLTTGLVSTTSSSLLIKTIQSKKINPLNLITHTFNFKNILNAYETFQHAENEKSLKVIINFD